MNFFEYFEISAPLGITRLISLLAHSFAPRSHVVGVKHLRSWNVCQHRSFHSLEIKVFTAIITRYRLEYFFEFICAEPSLELIKLTNNTLLTFTLYLTDYLYSFRAFGHYHKRCFCFLLAHHRIKLPMTENFFIFCFFGSFFYTFSLLLQALRLANIYPLLSYSQ